MTRRTLSYIFFLLGCLCIALCFMLWTAGNADSEQRPYTVTYKEPKRLIYCRAFECFLRRTPQTLTHELIYYELPRRDKRLGVVRSCLGKQGGCLRLKKNKETGLFQCVRRISKCVAVGPRVEPHLKHPHTISYIEAFAQGLYPSSIGIASWERFDLDDYWLEVEEDKANHNKWCRRNYTKRKRTTCKEEFYLKAHKHRYYKGKLVFATEGTIINGQWG